MRHIYRVLMDELFHGWVRLYFIQDNIYIINTNSYIDWQLSKKWLKSVLFDHAYWWLLYGAPGCCIEHSHKKFILKGSLIISILYLYLKPTPEPTVL